MTANGGWWWCGGSDSDQRRRSRSGEEGEEGGDPAPREGSFPAGELLLRVPRRHLHGVLPRAVTPQVRVQVGPYHLIGSRRLPQLLRASENRAQLQELLGRCRHHFHQRTRLHRGHVRQIVEVLLCHRLHDRRPRFPRRHARRLLVRHLLRR